MKISELINECRGELPKELTVTTPLLTICKACFTRIDLDGLCFVRFDVIQDAYEKELQFRELLESNIEMLIYICDICRIHNPQHKDCSWCQDHASMREAIEKYLNLSWKEIINKLEGMNED